MQLVVEGKLGGISTPILLDTGASINLVGMRFWDRWEQTGQFIHLSQPQYIVMGALSSKTLTPLGEGTLFLELDEQSRFPITFMVTKDFDDELLIGYPTLRKMGFNLSTGSGSTVSFDVFPGPVKNFMFSLLHSRKTPGCPYTRLKHC